MAQPRRLALQVVAGPGLEKVVCVAIACTEERLWERATAGDRAALDALLRLHEKSIYRYGLRMCGDEEAAREVLQRTMLTAFERLGTFRGDAKISTWLFALARSACSRYHRRNGSVPVHDLPLDAHDTAPTLADETRSPAERTEAAEMATIVATAIGMLPVSYREAIVLRDVEGLPAEEASQVLGLEVPALKSRLHRGRQLLKRNLATLLRESDGAVGSVRACEGLSAVLSALGARELDRSVCAAIEGHLEACPPCAGTLGGLRDATALCRMLPLGQGVPEPVQRAVRAALVAALGSTQTRVSAAPRN